MLNIMRSDLYRIIHGKCLYITFVLFLAFTGLQATFPNQVKIGIAPTNIPGLGSTSDQISGLRAPFTTMVYSDNIIYFMLAIIYVLAATDFSSGAIKNTLANGVSRVKLYFSKLVLASLFCILMALGGIIVSVLLSTVVNGFGGVVTGEYLLSVLRPFMAQLPMLIAAISIGMAILFISKKGAILNAVYLLFFLGLTVIILLVMGISDKLKELIKYDFLINLKMLSNFDAISSADSIRAISIGMVCIAMSTVLGIMAFRKSEIK